MAARTQEVDELSRLMRLVGHPLRSRIITELFVRGPGSSKGLADRLGDCTRGGCNHHMHVLSEAGLATLIRRRPVRGAEEHVYRMEPRSRWPFSSRFHPLLSYLIPATCSATDPFAIAIPLVLDAQGVAEVASMTQATRARAVEVGRAAAKRLQGVDPVNAVDAVLTVGLLGQAEGWATTAGGAGDAP